MIVISCFDYTTNMVRPWAEAGYTCYCVDIKHPPGESRKDNIIKVGGDMLDWVPPRKDIAFASFFPPCTDVSASGARWFKDKGLGYLWRALRLFDVAVKLAEWTGAPYMIENPVGTVSTYWRESDYTFDPCDYGDPYTKKTCLWTGGGFVMPKKNRIEPVWGSWMNKFPDSKGRSDRRSATPLKFAYAVFEANRKENRLRLWNR
jgi:hypothetical protein